MDLQKTVDAMIQAQLYAQSERNQLLADIAHIKSAKDLFNYILKETGDKIEDWNDFVKEQGQRQEIRKLFKPEIQFWLLKIKIAEVFGADTNDQDVLETIDESLRSQKHQSQRQMISQLYEIMVGEKIPENDAIQLCKKLQNSNYLFEELNLYKNKQETGQNQEKKYENEMKQLEKRIRQKKLQNLREYNDELREDIRGVPESVVDYRLKEAEIELGEIYLNKEGHVQPKLTESIKKLIESLNLTDSEAKKARANILNEKDIRRNLKILRKAVCGIDIFDMLRMIEKGRQEEKKIFDRIKKANKKMRVILFFGLSKAGKTTLITKLMGYSMKKMKINGIQTIQPSSPKQIKKEHQQLVIGYSNRSTTRYPKLYKVPDNFLLDKDDKESYDTFCMDSAGLEDTAGIEVEGSNRITMIELLKKIDQLQIFIVIKNWQDNGKNIQNIAKTTSSIIKDYSKIKKSIKFVFNNTNQGFIQTLHANVADLYENIQLEARNVIDDNYRQFFIALKNQTENLEDIQAIDILNLDIKNFYRKIFLGSFIQNTQFCFLHDIGAQCKREIKKLVERCKKSFYEEYKKGNTKEAQYFIDLLGKIGSEQKFESEANFIINEMKDDLRKCLEKNIKNFNTDLGNLQISYIKDKESRKKRFDRTYEDYKDLKTRIDKYKELDQYSKLDQEVEEKLNEVMKWYEAKTDEWKQKPLNRLQDRIDCTVYAQQFLERFFPQQILENYKKTLHTMEKDFHETIMNQIGKANEDIEINQHFRLLCALQQAQQKQIDYRQLKQAICQKFTILKKKATLINLNAEFIPGGIQSELVEIGINEERDIENIEKLLQFLKIVDLYPSELVDRQSYKKVYETIVITVPTQCKRRFQRAIKKSEDDEDSLTQENFQDSVEKIKILIKNLNILNRVKTIKAYYNDTLIDRYKDLEEIIDSSLKRFERIAIAFNENKASQIRTNLNKMRSQLRRLQNLVKITNKSELQKRFKTMKDGLAKSITNFLNVNDINETINFKNTQVLFRAFQKYAKVKEFQEIPKIIESENLKEDEISKVIERIQKKILSPIISMKEQIETKEKFYLDKLASYLSYIEVLDNQGEHILKSKFKGDLQLIEKQIKDKLGLLYKKIIVSPLEKLQQFITENLNLQETNIATILKKLSLRETEKYRKPFQMLASLRENHKVLKEQFFDDLDHQWQIHLDTFIAFQHAIQERIESVGEMNILDDLKRISNIMKHIEVRIGDEPKIFEELVGKINQTMKTKGEDEKQTLQRLLKTESGPTTFDVEKFKNIYSQVILNQTYSGKKNKRNLEEYFEGYKNNVQRRLEELKVEMLDIDDGYGKKILEVFQIVNRYNRHLQIIAAKCENTPFNSSQYELANIEQIMNYFEEKLLEYNLSIQNDFIYKEETVMKKESRNLQAIQSEIVELLTKYKFVIYRQKLGGKTFLSEDLKKMKQEREKKIEILNGGDNIIEKIDGDLMKFMKGLNKKEKQKIEHKIVDAMEKAINDLADWYCQDYPKYERERANIRKRFMYLDEGTHQRQLKQKYEAVQDKIQQKNNSDFKEIQKKQLDSVEDFLQFDRKLNQSHNTINIQKLAQFIRDKSSQVTLQKSFKFLNDKLWPRKDKLLDKAQSPLIQDEFIKIESRLLKGNERIIKESIDAIQNYYKNLVIDDEFNDFNSESSYSNRKQKLSEMVDSLNNFQSVIDNDRIIANSNKQIAKTLVSNINNFFRTMINEGETNFGNFKLIKNDILGNQEKIEITFLQIKSYEKDFNTLSLKKGFKEADKLKRQLKQLRILKEQLYSYVNDTITKPFDFYSIEIRENGEDQDNTRIQEFERNLQKLNVLMNSYNSCLLPPQEIKMDQIKKRIEESYEKIPVQYKTCLEENIRDSQDEQDFDKRLTYIPKLLKIIRSKPRKYFMKSEFYLEECQKILKNSISQIQKQLDEAVKNLNTDYLNKNKDYEEFKRKQEQTYKALLKEQQNQERLQLQKINDRYQAKIKDEEDEKMKKGLKSEWKSHKYEAMRTREKKKDNLTQTYQQRLKNKRNQNYQNYQQLVQNMIMKLITLKKLAGIDLVHKQIEEKVDQRLSKIKKNQIIKDIFSILQKSGNPIATRILDEHQLFKKLKGKKFSEETKATNSAQYILNNMVNSKSITQDQQDDFLFLYKKFEEQQNKYIQNFQQLKDRSTIDQLQQKIKSEGQQFKRLHDQDDAVIHSKRRVLLLAKIFALWSISSSVEEDTENQSEDYTVFYRAHAAQILCVIMILCMDDADLNNKLITFNRLAEIKTGEGKSIVLAVVSIFFALFGYEVHCACYSEMLSRRDKEEFAKLFTLCGVKEKIHYGVFETIIKKVINQKDQKMDKEERYEEIIKEMLIEQLPSATMDWLSKTWLGKKIQFIKKFKNFFAFNSSDKPKKVLLIDEIDVLFNKDYYGDTFNQSINLRDPSIISLFEFIWKNKADLNYQFIEKSQEFNKVVEKFKPLKQILENQINGMLAALTTYKDQSYVINDQKIMYKIEDTLKEVSYRYNTVYAYLEEFKKHKVSEIAFNQNMTINLCVAEFSYACLPEYYRGVLGVTGTLTCLPEYIKKHLQQRYKISESQLFPIPSVYTNNSQNQKILSPLCVDYESLFATIVDNISENFSQERPILVFFRNKQDMLEFYNCNQFKKFQEFTSYITEEHNYFERSQRVKNSSLKKTITLMTHSFIRGTDFKLYSKKAIEAGGFHAIVAYLIDSPADYIQATGRIGRQGKKGSFIEIYKKEDLQILDIKIQQPNPTQLVKQRRLLKQEKEQDSYQEKLRDSKKKHDEAIKVFQEKNFDQKLLIDYVANKNKFPKFLNVNKARLILMIDATVSMENLFHQLKIILPQIFDDTYLTLKEKKFPGCLEMQIVLYRNYNSNFNQILEVSTFDNQGGVLKSFISQSQVSGGWHNEAIEVALQYANTLQNINEIILIGDIGGNLPKQIQLKRARYKKLESQRIQKGMTPTTMQDQVKKLIKSKVKINGLYLKNIQTTKQYFESVSQQTSGTAKYINIYDKGSSKAIAEFIVERALMNIGCDKGNELIATYKQILLKRMEK